MRRANLITLIFVISLISFSFLSIESSSGQTNLPHSLSDCIICTQVIPDCSENETFVPQTCNKCAHCITTSSSSSGKLSCITDNDCPPGVCSSSGTFRNYICGNNVCNQIFYFADPCEFSQSSSGSSISLNKDFNGLWEGKSTNCKKCKKTRKIALNLCIENKILTGTINIPEYLEGGIIISQNIISNTEVKAIIEDQNKTPKEVILSLTDKRHLNIYLTDRDITFEVKKSGNSKDCLKKASDSGNSKDGLLPDTKIRTNEVQKRIADIKKGDIVLSDDEEPVKVKNISKAPVKNHKVLKILFNDATVLEISPGHPTADGRKFKDLKMGDKIDGRMVVSVKLIPYTYSHTYDILPNSKSRNYYANGILIGSSLK